MIHKNFTGNANEVDEHFATLDCFNYNYVIDSVEHLGHFGNNMTIFYTIYLDN